MEAHEIANQHELDGFVGSQKRSQFLQSWQWGEFQRQLPSRVVRLGAWDGDQLVGSVQMIERALPLGQRYWYIPRGPVINGQLSVTDFQLLYTKLIAEIMARAEKSGVMFVRCEPPLERASQFIFETLTKGYRRQPTAFVQPQDSWYLEIASPADKLLSAMHPKTRYNIKLAERKGVTVRTAGAIDDFEAFWKVMEATAKRDHIKPHSRSYYREMYRILGHTGFMKMYLAEYQGNVIAANLVVFFGDTATYLHGASGDASREVMAPYLLQWRQIQDAVSAGMKWYDFGGIAPVTADANHRWAGITRFKRGFGGTEINYVGAHDLILDMFWYRMYRTVQKVKI
jgi:peptidoglycan pentaglycine glycine transferase (the first glycine)